MKWHTTRLDPLLSGRGKRVVSSFFSYTRAGFGQEEVFSVRTVTMFPRIEVQRNSGAIPCDWTLRHLSVRLRQRMRGLVPREVTHGF